MTENTSPAQALSDATATGHQVAIKALAEVGQNKCNCSDTCYFGTRNIFHQGHDARMVSRLVDQVVAREGDFAQFSLDDAVTELKRRGGTVRLEEKLRSAVAKAHDLWTKREDARARKAAKAAQPKAARKSAKAAKTAAPAQVEAPRSIETPNVKAKVGRWTYTGTLIDDPQHGQQFRYANRLHVMQTTDKFTVVDR